MKDIFGEYGFLIIMALAVCVVVALVLIFKEPISAQVQALITQFSSGIHFPSFGA